MQGLALVFHDQRNKHLSEGCVLETSCKPPKPKENPPAATRARRGGVQRDQLPQPRKKALEEAAQSWDSDTSRAKRKAKGAQSKADGPSREASEKKKEKKKKRPGHSLRL